ncbi:hypothetical protein [Providencia manganoxydans]|uniref:hypothetical protein n=1 Tax=Providencia manganoxydans TaxID=2923283 RepID=UPI0034E3B4BC
MKLTSMTHPFSRLYTMLMMVGIALLELFTGSGSAVISGWVYALLYHQHHKLANQG